MFLHDRVNMKQALYYTKNAKGFGLIASSQIG